MSSDNVWLKTWQGGGGEGSRRPLTNLMETSHKPLGDLSQTSHKPLGTSRRPLTNLSEPLGHLSQTSHKPLGTSRRPPTNLSETSHKPLPNLSEPLGDLSQTSRNPSGGTLAARENPGLAQSWRGQAQLQFRCTGFTEPLEYLWGSNAACSASDLHIQQCVPELEHAGASSHLKVLIKTRSLGSKFSASAIGLLATANGKHSVLFFVIAC